MRGIGHVMTLLPPTSALVGRGYDVHFMTDASFAPLVGRSGARFIDLYAGRPPESVDATSLPFPSRSVTFAGVYAEAITREIAGLNPQLILYDNFSVIAKVAARALGIPCVNIVANHAGVPERMIAIAERTLAAKPSPECLAAIEKLRDVHGLEDASPYSYFTALSDDLNLYPEPRQFLAAADGPAFEPLEFFGSLTPELQPAHAGDRLFPPRSGRTRLFVSFGTVIWKYFEREAVAALAALAAESEEFDVLISLGNRELSQEALEPLDRPNIRVVGYFDQWSVLAEADLFVTHNGLNSTHEAIYHGVPMLSYPFFGDQPALARACADLGLAVPLTETPLAPLQPGDLRAAAALVSADADGFASRLSEAREWELETIAGRDAIVDRILAL